MDKYLERYFAVTKGKKKMLGVYLYDYLDDKTQPMDITLFEKQLSKYFDLLRENKIDGIIFCSNTVGDAPLETNKLLKEYITKYGDEEI